MSKNALITLTIVLCVVAAGVGGFFATRATTGTRAAETATAAVLPQNTPAASETPTATAPAPVEPAQDLAAVPASREPAPRVEPAAVETPAARPVAPARPAPTTSGASAVRPRPAPPLSQVPAQAPAVAVAVETPRPELTQPAPAGSATATSAAPPMDPAPLPPAPQPDPVQAEPKFDEVVVSADSVIGLKLETTVHSETSRVEDPVEARVTRDVRVGTVVAIPAGSRVLGVVSQLERGGKMKTRARLSVRFHTLVLADGTRTTIQTDHVYREGDAPGQEAASKMGAAAAGGAILGALLGGGKGAAIGGSIGAAGGAAAVMSGERNPAVLKAGTAVTVRLLQPVPVLVSR